MPQLEIGRDGRPVSSPKDDIGNERDGSAKRQWGTALERPGAGKGAGTSGGLVVG